MTIDKNRWNYTFEIFIGSEKKFPQKNYIELGLFRSKDPLQIREKNMSWPQKPMPKDGIMIDFQISHKSKIPKSKKAIFLGSPWYPGPKKP